MIDYILSWNDYLLLITLGAFFIDLVLGDPHYSLHPIRLMGHMINGLERVIYPFRWKKLGGILLLFSSFIIIIVPIVLILCIVKEHYSIIYFAVAVFLTYSLFALRSLSVEVDKIRCALLTNDLSLARMELSYLVGWDTKSLSVDDIIQDCIEILSENFVDGVVSPLFYAFLGGLPLLVLYKITNTLDSMVGYKNSKYIDFGWASAKLDDIMNFVPARLSAFLFIPLGAFILKQDGINSLKTVLSDRLNHESPNSAHPESAFAGALNIQLGGPAPFAGVIRERPTIGKPIQTLSISQINKANRLMLISAFISLFFFFITTCSILTLTNIFFLN